MPKPFAWSFSSLETYERCPKQFYHLKIKRDFKESFEGPEAAYGKEVHKAFEDRLIRGKRLPLDLTHHEKVMLRLAKAKGEGMPEQKMALNINFEPTGFFDNDVWVRGIIDYVKINGTRGLIVDHKTGKQKDGFDQVRLMSAMLSAYMPEIEHWNVCYYWTKTKCFTAESYTAKEIPVIWNDILPRVEVMQAAIRHDDFPARENFLCKRHCCVKSCVHNGG